MTPACAEAMALHQAGRFDRGGGAVSDHPGPRPGPRRQPASAGPDHRRTGRSAGRDRADPAGDGDRPEPRAAPQQPGPRVSPAWPHGGRRCGLPHRRGAAAGGGGNPQQPGDTRCAIWAGIRRRSRIIAGRSHSRRAGRISGTIWRMRWRRPVRRPTSRSAIARRSSSSRISSTRWATTAAG